MLISRDEAKLIHGGEVFVKIYSENSASFGFVITEGRNNTSIIRSPIIYDTPENARRSGEQLIDIIRKRTLESF